MPAKYRVGVIGRTGKGNYGHGLDTVWREIPVTQVVAVADESKPGRTAAAKKTGAAKAYADYREMLETEKLDIVAVAPRWIDQHREMALACAEHGCHVFIEKPFCRDLVEADEVVQAFDSKHLKLVIAHQSRFSPIVVKVKELIAQGVIGDVIELRAHGKEDRRGGGEDLWVLGTHVLDLSRVIVGDPIECSATVLNENHLVGPNDVYDGAEGIGPLAGDNVAAMYRFENGVTGYFGSVRDRGGRPTRFGLEIFGSKGVFQIASGYTGDVQVLVDSSWAPGRTNSKWQRVSTNGIDKPETLKASGNHTGNVKIVEALIHSIENDTQPDGNIQDARAATEMIAAIFESHRLRRTVSFPLENRKNPLSLL